MEYRGVVKEHAPYPKMNGHTRKRVHFMSRLRPQYRALRTKISKNFSKILAFKGVLFYTTEAVCLGMKR